MDMLLVLHVLVHDMFLMVLVLVPLIRPWEMLVSLLMVPLVLFLELCF
jgi:hypothetical protein